MYLSQKSLNLEYYLIMSKHQSYRSSAKGAVKRNVLKRYERINVLREQGKWVDGVNNKVTALPKTLVK